MTARVRDRAIRIVAVALVVALAAYIYRPWRDVGFDIEDFSEFQPLLERSSTFGTRNGALLDYYATQGRLNFVIYYALAAKWTLLGPSPIAWQYLRFGQMLVLAGLAFWLVRSFRLGNLPATATSLLFLFSSAAASSFTRLTMSEPLATTILLMGLLIALRYQHTPHWKASAALIAVLLALVVGSKEVLVVCVPFVVLCAVLWSPGGWCRPRLSPRNVGLAAAVGLGTTVVGAAILLVAAHGGTESYASQYGRAPGTLLSFLVIFGRMVLPVQRPEHPVIDPPSYPANVLVYVLLFAGILLWWRSTMEKPGPALTLFASLPVLGAAVYAPWPRFEEFYSLPFQLGVGLMLAFALEATVRRSIANGRVAGGLFGIAVLYMAVNASRTAERRFASRAVHREMVEVLREVTNVDSVLVVTSQGGRSWPTLAPTLARVAARPGSQHPPVLGFKCGEVTQTAGLPTSILVMQYVRDCGAIESPDRTIVERYGYWNWRTWHRGIDSVRVDVKRREQIGHPETEGSDSMPSA